MGVSVRALQLADFRSHAALELRLDARPVCLIGPNGVGKTNILEALSQLAPGRGLRGAALAELARGGADAAADRPRPWSVFAEIDEDGESRRIGVAAERTLEGGLKRVMRLDGRTPTAAELAKAVRMAWLTPAMDRLFSGSPGERRRFLDRLTLARAPEHGQAAAGYERAMRERQRLLAEASPDRAWLAALEQAMAAHGAAMAAARVETLQRLRSALEAEALAEFPMASLALEGELEQAFAEGAVSADLEDRFAAALRAARGRDGTAGRALTGPHRSDLLVRHAEKDMPAELCSTGEQKALLLRLVAAHARALAGDPAAGPCLLLLDEAAAHLDPRRREKLAELVVALPGQAWLTGADESLAEAFGATAQRIALAASSS